MKQNSFHTQNIPWSHISLMHPKEFILRVPGRWKHCFVYSSSKWWSALCRAWRGKGGDGRMVGGWVSRDLEGVWAEDVFNEWLIVSVCFYNVSQTIVIITSVLFMEPVRCWGMCSSNSLKSPKSFCIQDSFSILICGCAFSPWGTRLLLRVYMI